MLIKIITLLFAPAILSAQPLPRSMGAPVYVTNSSITVNGAIGVLGLANVSGSTVTVQQGTTPWNTSGSSITAFQGGPWSVTVPNVVRVTPSTEAFSINGISYYRTDVYAAPGAGPIVNVSSSPLRTFGLEVLGGATWDVLLEGSLDGANFTLLLEHLTATGNGVTLYSGTSMQPSLYIRSRVVALTGGPLVVTFVGVQ